MVLKTMPLELFLNNLAAKSPTPGGGAVAALSGAMAASLNAMVIHFTLGKRGYETLQEQFTSLLWESEQLCSRLSQCMQDDANAFEEVMAAYKARRQGSTDQEEQQNQALEQALKKATNAPIECAQLCHQLMLHSRTLAEAGNVMIISDAGVAVMSAYAGLMSAALNVQTNIASIKDQDFVQEVQKRLQPLLEQADTLRDEVYALVEKRLQQS